MATISKSGVTDGQVVEAVHVTRIVDALDGTSIRDIIIGGGSNNATIKGDNITIESSSAHAIIDVDPNDTNINIGISIADRAIIRHDFASGTQISSSSGDIKFQKGIRINGDIKSNSEISSSTLQVQGNTVISGTLDVADSLGANFKKLVVDDVNINGFFVNALTSDGLWITDQGANLGVKIDDGGGVGIGTGSAGPYQLQVDGDANIKGNLTVTGSINPPPSSSRLLFAGTQIATGSNSVPGAFFEYQSSNDNIFRTKIQGSFNKETFDKILRVKALGKTVAKGTGSLKIGYQLATGGGSTFGSETEFSSSTLEVVEATVDVSAVSENYYNWFVSLKGLTKTNATSSITEPTVFVTTF